jgi:tungstate transport system substrate-binding protein
MQVNPERFENVNDEGAEAFSQFFTGEEAQEIIRNFGVEEYGQPLFFPDAGRREEDLAN